MEDRAFALIAGDHIVTIVAYTLGTCLVVVPNSLFAVGGSKPLFEDGCYPLSYPVSDDHFGTDSYDKEFEDAAKVFHLPSPSAVQQE